MRDDAKKVIADLRVNVPSISVEAGQLSGGQRQSPAIGRATSQQGRIIIMDEPTAALGVRESRKVLGLILRLKARGIGIVVISHNMRHVFSVFDRIMVLRHGRVAGVRRKGETTPDEIVRLIVGVDALKPSVSGGPDLVGGFDDADESVAEALRREAVGPLEQSRWQAFVRRCLRSRNLMVTVVAVALFIFLSVAAEHFLAADNLP